MGMDLPPFRRAGCHLWLVVFLTVICTGLYLILLVLPSYRTGLYLYTPDQIRGAQPSTLYIPEWLHDYWKWTDVAVVLYFYVQFIILPLALGSVLLQRRTMTHRDHIIWGALTIITFFIFRATFSLASAMVDYLLD